jgi:isoleucyl-tRNA synthetase
MGADEIRWLYCRHNPALNINFGPGPAEEVRSSYVLKLWNTYAFFCNYARLDGFDPSAPEVPVKDRPDIDRWILSDLQLLIKEAHEAFEDFNVMAFCLEAEKFVDDRLSNWYVRRNRRRFWKSEKGGDKDAAYQTLYTVLVTLTKLIAPVMPFLSEALYQNLVKKAGAKGTAESVHHADFPQVDNALVDERLSADMDALLRLVSLGSAARNAVKIKVRQPLAELKVQPGSDAERRAVERFSDQIAEELNIKKITLHDAKNGPLLQFEVKLNMKTAGSKLGPRIKSVQTALAQADPAQIAEKVQAGHSVELTCADGGPVTLDAADITVQPKMPAGWAGLADRGTQLALDARISEDLDLEGKAREIIRHVQNARKDADLEMEDRIMLYLKTDSPVLQKALERHRDYISAETLVARWATQPIGEGAYRVEVKVDAQALAIELKKA